MHDHIYDLLNYSSKGNLIKVKETVELIMRDKVSGFDNVCKGDYDERTALHLACSEGHYPIVHFFIENGYFENILVKDRWDNTPLDDANRENHKYISRYLKKKIR